MKFSKCIAYLAFVLCSNASFAQSHVYMGCEWLIPTGFLKVSDSEYRNQIDEDYISDWSPASILFTEKSDGEVDYYSELNSTNNNQVVLLEHKPDVTDEFQYYSFFIKQLHFGEPAFLEELMISRENKSIVFSGLQKAEAQEMIGGCLPLLPIETHYDALNNFKHGNLDIIRSDERVSVLVP